MIEQEDHRYVVQDRGNRALPDRFHARYWALRLLAERLQEISQSEAISAGETIVDYGCGNKPYEHLFKSRFRQYLGADFPGNTDAQLTVGPRGELPLPDDSLDCILSTQVLEHVEEPRLYLGEAYRTLRVGGSLILSTHGTWCYHPDPADYWRWTVDGLRREITAAGFDIWTTQSVLGLASSAVQLWQEATLEKVPRMLRSSYIWSLQSLIGLIEHRTPRQLSLDACIYLIVAKKRARRDIPHADEERYQRSLATSEASLYIPPAARTILVDQDEVGSDLVPDRQVLPFLERDGKYWGPPKDDEQALLEFERMRAGADFIVFAWPAFWWLDHFPALNRRLHSECRRVLDNDRLKIFEIRR